MKESCFCLMVSTPKKFWYCIHLRSKKHLILSLEHLSKRHYSEIMNERNEKEDFSTLFYYLPSITDRKEDINRHRINVNLWPIDCSISFIESLSKKEEKFNPLLLNSTDQDLKKPQVEMLYGVFRQMAEYSNNNLKRGANFLLAKLNKKSHNIPWVGASKQRFDSSLYKLTY